MLVCVLTPGEDPVAFHSPGSSPLPGSHPFFLTAARGLENRELSGVPAFSDQLSLFSVQNPPH